MTFATSTTGSITPQAITVTALSSSKSYDGSNSSLATPTVTSGTLLGGDTAAFSKTYDTKNVGSDKILTATGSVNDGNGGSNYTVSFNTSNMGLITSRLITVTAGATTKGYDGSTTSTATPSITSGSLAGGDTAAFSETSTQGMSARARRSPRPAPSTTATAVMTIP